MNTIANYLETMFLNLPETQQILQVKADLLANMEDKYQELKAAGISENEAVGTVISEFGNIDELLEELYISNGESVEEGPLPIIDQETAEAYIAAKRSIGKWIGSGVLFCILGVCFLLFLSQWDRDGFEIIGVIGMFMFIAIGVALFIVSGFHINAYEQLEKGVVLVGSVRKELEEKKKNYEKSYMVAIIVGVTLCILGVILMLGSTLAGTDQAEEYGAIALLLCAGSGTFFFIYSGNMISSYTTLLKQDKKRQPTPGEQKASTVMNVISSIFWPLMVVIYLWWSFSTGSWAISWVIWPLSGVLHEIVEKCVNGVVKN